MSDSAKEMIELYALYLEGLKRISFQERREIKKILKEYKVNLSEK